MPKYLLTEITTHSNGETQEKTSEHIAADSFAVIQWYASTHYYNEKVVAIHVKVDTINHA